MDYLAIILLTAFIVFSIDHINDEEDNKHKKKDSIMANAPKVYTAYDNKGNEIYSYIKK